MSVRASYTKNIMKKAALFTLVLGALALACFAAIADLSGKWIGSLTVPEGTVDVNYNFKADGNKLTGTVQASGSELPIDSGKINGNDFSFVVTDPEGVHYLLKGKYYPAGDTCGTDISFKGMTVHSTLKRQGK